MSASGAALDQFYEQITRGDISIHFDKIGFLNIGYWKGVEDSIEIAQINLIETLLAFFQRTEGTVLDVACGKGVSTKFLTKYFDPKKINGINVSEIQLRICKSIAPECSFRPMDATRLDFADGTFDNVLCIEAAQHFRTRSAFLREAYRVLTPGGRLAMHDVVFHDPSHPEAPDPDIWPKENYVPNVKAYESDLFRCGFKYVRVDDITEFSMTSAVRHLARKAEREFEKSRDYRALQEAMDALKSTHPWMPENCSWYMAYAIK